MKALVGAFNQEKALVGAFLVIVQPVLEPMDRFTALVDRAPCTLHPPSSLGVTVAGKVINLHCLVSAPIISARGRDGSTN